MALATLCKQFNSVPNQDKPDSLRGYIFRFRAFIVDHKAREGSSIEARLTAQRLQRLGLSSYLGGRSSFSIDNSQVSSQRS